MPSSAIINLPLANVTNTVSQQTVASSSDSAGSFAETLAKQQTDNAPAANKPAAKTPDKPAKPAASGSKTDTPANDDGKGTAMDAIQALGPETTLTQPAAAPDPSADPRLAEAAAALALTQAQAALPPPVAPTLPQQALEIAAQVAEVQARVAAANAALKPINNPANAAADAAVEWVATRAGKPVEPPPETVLPLAARAEEAPVLKAAETAPTVTRPAARAALPEITQTTSASEPAPQPAAPIAPRMPVPELPMAAKAAPAEPLAHEAFSAAIMAQPQSLARQLASDATPALLGPHIASPVGATQWGQELSRQVISFSQNLAQGTHTAELRLDPPDLGPLRITLSINDGIANASFTSAHAAVRQAVESALPQLQQALSQAGISLGQANVGEQGQQAMTGGGQSQGQQGGSRSDPDDAGAQPQHETDATGIARAPAHDGLVNTFA
ncbi:flagellar hook-length control protein FliK [Bordetella avium]|uniref:Flagellar hook-length control protein n=3 Tax=Bordetella avium TaxID=521 RepID=Q2L189_BORA1|nr:flagellar hook-length control protein FliK [Bordetella avium]CAJ49319.1 flagellar hook-length control protein [Bordetella avium 197N]